MSDPMNISGVCAEEAFYKSDMIYDIFVNGYIFPLNEYSWISIYNIINNIIKIFIWS